MEKVFQDVLTVTRYTDGTNKCKVLTVEGTEEVECKNLHVLGATAAHVTAKDPDTYVMFEEGVKCDLSDEGMTCWKVLEP